MLAEYTTVGVRHATDGRGENPFFPGENVTQSVAKITRGWQGGRTYVLWKNTERSEKISRCRQK